MIFVDTNYFLRYLIDDGSPQHCQATEFFQLNAKKKNSLTTSTLVFFEVFWTITSYYQKSDLETVEIMKNLLKMAFINFEAKEILAKSLERASLGVISFEDCFNLEWAKIKKVTAIASFDKKLVKVWLKF